MSESNSVEMAVKACEQIAEKTGVSLKELSEALAPEEETPESMANEALEGVNMETEQSTDKGGSADTEDTSANTPQDGEIMCDECSETFDSKGGFYGHLSACNADSEDFTKGLETGGEGVTAESDGDMIVVNYGKATEYPHASEVMAPAEIRNHDKFTPDLIPDKHDTETGVERIRHFQGLNGVCPTCNLMGCNKDSDQCSLCENDKWKDSESGGSNGSNGEIPAFKDLSEMEQKQVMNQTENGVDMNDAIRALGY